MVGQTLPRVLEVNTGMDYVFADALQQTVQGESRLQHVVSYSQFARLDDKLTIRFIGQQNHRNAGCRRAGSQDRQQRQSIHAWHMDVKYDEGGSMQFKQSQG